MKITKRNYKDGLVRLQEDYEAECEKCRYKTFVGISYQLHHRGEGPATQVAKKVCNRCGYKSPRPQKEEMVKYGVWKISDETPVVRNMNEVIDKALDDVQEIFNRSPKRYEEQIENIITSILDLKEEVNAIV